MQANAEESLLSRDLFEPGVLEYVGSRGNCSEGVPCQSLSSNSCLKEIRYTKYPDGTDSLEPQDEGMLESKTEMASVKLSEQGLCCSSVSGVRDEGELYNWLSGTDIKYLVRTSPPDQTVDITIALNGNASFYSHLCTHRYRVTSGKVFGMQVLDRTTPKLVERRPWLRALNPTHLLAIVVGECRASVCWTI